MNGKVENENENEKNSYSAYSAEQTLEEEIRKKYKEYRENCKEKHGHLKETDELKKIRRLIDELARKRIKQGDYDFLRILKITFLKQLSFNATVYYDVEEEKFGTRAWVSRSEKYFSSTEIAYDEVRHMDGGFERARCHQSDLVLWALRDDWSHAAQFYEESFNFSEEELLLIQTLADHEYNHSKYRDEYETLDLSIFETQDKMRNMKNEDFENSYLKPLLNRLEIADMVAQVHFSLLG